MPIYEYQCDCGKRLDVLVRGGREPRTCDEAADRNATCFDGGKLTRLLSAPNIGRSDAGGRIAERGGGAEATCGACGQAPGSCEYD